MMVETEKEYILQWSGHAESITEKLRHYVSKQSLVDVTLLCQDEKLRVHKLVLASTSGYFEELLEQDLGQEPIILLKDLHFDILKAMVEFMYCGETTIAHCHLKSLLDAAQVFKVKDLESIVNIMIDDNEAGPENESENSSSDVEEEDSGEASDTSSPQSPTKNSQNIKLNKNHVPDTNNVLTNNLFDDTSLKLNDATNNTTSDNDNSHENTLNELEKSTKNDDKIVNKSEDDDDNYKLNNIDCNDLSTVVGECLKVYSHKNRKSSSKDKNKCENLNIFEMISSQGLTTNGIDLSCDTSCDITLPSTLLEMDQTTESIWNLGNDKNKNIRDDLLNLSDFSKRKMKELFSIDNRNISVNKRKPVLRRSVRLNQVDNDDSLNNNNNNSNHQHQSEINKSRKKFKNNFSLKSMKAKRKNKESDENNVNLRKAVNSRSLRSSSKLVSKSNERCTLSRLDKDEKSSKSQKLNQVKQTGDVAGPLKLNTIASVDRSLWGDMSDVIENCENGERLLPDYAPSKEIPFAVGLLPLRAALERMQATLDYQPRKTRSSAAPGKDPSTSLKRKANSSDGADSSLSSPTKKINCGQWEDETSAIFRVERREMSSEVGGNNCGNLGLDENVQPVEAAADQR